MVAHAEPERPVLEVLAARRHERFGGRHGVVTAVGLGVGSQLGEQYGQVVVVAEGVGEVVQTVGERLEDRRCELVEESHVVPRVLGPLAVLVQVVDVMAVHGVGQGVASPLVGLGQSAGDGVEALVRQLPFVDQLLGVGQQ